MKSTSFRSLSTETFEYRHYSQCNRAISRLRRHIVPEKGRSTSVWGDLTEVRVAKHKAHDELGVSADSTYDFKALAHFYDTFSKKTNIHRIPNWFLLKLLYSNGNSWELQYQRYCWPQHPKRPLISDLKLSINVSHNHIYEVMGDKSCDILDSYWDPFIENIGKLSVISVSSKCSMWILPSSSSQFSVATAATKSISQFLSATLFRTVFCEFLSLE